MHIMKKLLNACLGALLCFCPFVAKPQQKNIVFCGTEKNDLYPVLVNSGFTVKLVKDPLAAIEATKPGGALLVMAEEYPAKQVRVSAAMLKKIRDKKIRLYVEYLAEFPGLQIGAVPFRSNLERAVIASPELGENLPPMALLGINDCYVMPVQQAQPLMVMAKVAGFTKAAYGINDVETRPLLFRNGGDVLIQTQQFYNGPLRAAGCLAIALGVYCWLGRSTACNQAGQVPFIRFTCLCQPFKAACRSKSRKYPQWGGMVQ